MSDQLASTTSGGSGGGARGGVPVRVQPPSPQVESDTLSVSGYPHHPVIPRKPMHRSISVPLVERIGTLRHPRPLRSPTSPDHSSPLPSPMRSHRILDEQEEEQQQQQQKDEDETSRSTSLRSQIESPPSSKSSNKTQGAQSESALLAQLILDAIQLPISHLLHIIPPHLLDESHETLSATSLAMPVTSIEAFMESFRGINWLCDAFAEKCQGNKPNLDRSTDSMEESKLDRLPSPAPPLEAVTKVEPPSTSPPSTSPGPSSPRNVPVQDEVPVDHMSDLASNVGSVQSTFRAIQVEEMNAQKKSAFDIFEMTQRAADVVSGQAANKGSELVLALNGLAGEDGLLAGMQSMADGDGEAIRYVVIHALSRLVELTPSFSTIEIALHIAPDSKGKSREGSFPCVFDFKITFPRGDCSIEDLTILHPEQTILQFAQAQWTMSPAETPDSHRATLSFVDLHVTPSEVGDVLSPKPTGDNYERQRFLPHISLAEEPSAAQLSSFASFGLQGKRIALHSFRGSPFAKNLTGLLQASGCEVTHMPLDGAFGTDSAHSILSNNTASLDSPAGSTARTAVAISAGRPAFVRYSTALGIENQINEKGSDDPDTAVLDPVTGVPITLSRHLASSSSLSSRQESSAEDTKSSDSTAMERQQSEETIKAGDKNSQKHSMEAFSLVMVDDDIDTLQRELLRLSTALPLLRGALGQHTPYIEQPGNPFPFGTSSRNGHAPGSFKRGGEDLTQAIVFFTSLKSFRSVRDLVQPIMESATQAMGDRSAEMMPEIIIVPKPAGHRRIITALHSAMNRIVVDPFFAPLATTPMLPHWFEATQMSRETGGKMYQEPPKHQSTKKGNSPKPPISPKKLRKAADGRHDILRLSDLPKPDPVSMTHHLGSSGAQQNGFARTQTPALELSLEEAETHKGASNPTELNRSQPPSSHGSLVPDRSTHGSSSPMPADALEYFSETAARLGSTGSSAMVIQSPDGRPAGIFFHPKTSSTPGSVRSSGRRVTPTGSISGRIADPRVGGRRRSAERLSAPNSPAQVMQSLAGALETVDLKQGSSPAPGHRSSTSSAVSTDSHSERSTKGLASSTESAHSGPSTARLSRWNDAAPGTIFAPQVGIDSVLQSGQLPLATPLPQKTPSFDDRGRGDLQRKSSNQNQADDESGSAPHDVHKETFERAERTEERPIGSEDDDSDIEPRRMHAEDTAGRAFHSPTVQEDSDRANIVGDRNDARSPQNAPSASGIAAIRPSAQPQAGIMIGAGFASSGRRGGGPRRPQKREKVLPPIKVLIVEDNVINQRILQQFMKRKKIQFEIAGNGAQAVEKWQQGSFHLILMDIQLPVMDGISATKEIRRQESLANVGVLPATPPVSTTGNSSHRLELKTPASSNSNSVPATPFRASVIIVALTASVLNSDRVAALAAGCNDFLNKPVSLPWLEKKIIEWGSMQYILLSGAGVFDNERRNNRGISKGQGALAAAAANPDLRKAFGKAPDAKAKVLASKLHLPLKRTASPALKTDQGAVSGETSGVGVGPAEDSPTHRNIPVEDVEAIPAAVVTVSEPDQPSEQVENSTEAGAEAAQGETPTEVVPDAGQTGSQRGNMPQ
ncbi:unnamed protein product [Sympodiomycopsis kandeliae]